MKVMIINSLYYPNVIGGAEKSTQVIAENLKRLGVEPVVVSVGENDSTNNINGVKVYYIYHSNVYWSYYSKTKNPVLKAFWHLKSLYNPGILKKLLQIIEIEKPDVINTNNLAEFSVGIWRLVKKMNIPLVHTLRDFSLLCPRATLFRRNNVCVKKNIICVLMLKFKKLFSNYPDAVVGNSKFAIDLHIKSGFFKKPEKFVIYNSLETEKIIPAVKNSIEIRFGYVGLLSYHKGTEFLLQAFKESKIEDFEGLYIFGKGITEEYEDYLKEKYKSDKIIFKGYKKPGEAFNMIDILIVPSICLDSLPRVIYEAYSYGIPVIGADRGGIPEIIDKGKTGFVYNPDLKAELIEKIKIFLDNPDLIGKMAVNCYKKAQEFLPDTVLNKYINVYRQVMKKPVEL